MALEKERKKKQKQTKKKKQFKTFESLICNMVGWLSPNKHFSLGLRKNKLLIVTRRAGLQNSNCYLKGWSTKLQLLLEGLVYKTPIVTWRVGLQKSNRYLKGWSTKLQSLLERLVYKTVLQFSIFPSHEEDNHWKLLLS